MGTAVAERAATAVKLKPIADVVRQIKTHIYDAANAEARCVKHRLQAGQLLLQLRERIESGEEGDGIDWGQWCEANIERSRKDCERLMRIAAAEDPEAALLEEREKTRLAVAKHRAKKAEELTVSSNVTVEVIDDESGARRRLTDDELSRLGGAQITTACGMVLREGGDFHLDGEINEGRSGCDYDPNLPDYEDEPPEDSKRRGFLWCASPEAGSNARYHADWFIEKAPDKIDDEMIEAALQAALAWQDLAMRLREARDQVKKRRRGRP